MREAEVSLKGLFFYILKRWKSLLVGAALFALLFGAYGVYRGANTRIEPAEASDNSNDDTDSDNYCFTLAYIIESENANELNGISGAYASFLESYEFRNYVSSHLNEAYEEILNKVSVSRNPINVGDTITGMFLSIQSNSEDEMKLLKDILIDYIGLKTDELHKLGYKYKIALLDEAEFDRYIVETDELDPEKTEEMVVSPSRTYIPFKHIVFGTFFGFFLVALFHSAIYVFSNKLGEDDDVENIFGVYLLGVIPGKGSESASNKLKNLGRRIFSQEESCNLISTKIVIMAKKSNTKKLGIVGCAILKNSKEISDVIINNLKASGIDAEIIDNPLYDQKNVQMLSSLDHIILLEKVGETIRTEIWNEMELARKFGVNVDGIIMIGE